MAYRRKASNRGFGRSASRTNSRNKVGACPRGGYRL